MYWVYYFILGFMAVIVTSVTLQYLYQTIHEHEWGFLEGEGRSLRMLEPGLHYAPRGKVTRVDRRTHVMDVRLDMRTKDDRSIKVTLLMFVRVLDPERTVRFEGDWRLALVEAVKGDTPRLMGHWTSEDAYWERWRLGREMMDIVNRETSSLGVEVEGIHVEDVILHV